ncbi:hypothetical protein AYI72_18775 [Shewanella algae]|nr:hypothetical protein BS332_03655 [Shewanella algae]TVK97977.1 hypothetical protein AYI72_18775 [Shewanella algae]UYA17415.1 hypothetical protein D3X10_17275 [Shewanella algae]
MVLNSGKRVAYQHHESLPHLLSTGQPEALAREIDRVHIEKLARLFWHCRPNKNGKLVKKAGIYSCRFRSNAARIPKQIGQCSAENWPQFTDLLIDFSGFMKDLNVLSFIFAFYYFILFNIYVRLSSPKYTTNRQ